MATYIRLYTKYNSGNDFGGGLLVKKFRVKKAGSQNNPNTMRVEFEGGGSVQEAWMYLEPEMAISLARNLLNVAEGYITESECAFT